MDKKEVSEVLREQERVTRQLKHAEFEKWILGSNVDVYRVTAPSGTVYEVEREAFWDDENAKTIRVMINANVLNDRSVSKPASTDFIIAKDGSFIGE